MVRSTRLNVTLCYTLLFDQVCFLGLSELVLPVNGMVKQREILKHFGEYREGGDCRIGLVIPDTPVSAILVLQSCKKHVN